jgi:hypothetical protein
MSVTHLVGHGSVTFGFVWVEPTDTERASIWRVLALAKVKALKASEQHWGCTMDPTEG